MNWISVDERLPLPETDVLVLNDRLYARNIITAGLFSGYGEICMNGHNDLGWASWETEDSVKGKITHWMPLPELPK